MTRTDMGCSCVCSMDYEGPSVSSVKIVRGRKAYRCCECGETIEKGERHESYAGCWEGEWTTHRTCLGCKAIRDDLCSCGFVFGQLREAVGEVLGMDYVTGQFYTTGFWKDRD